MSVVSGRSASTESHDNNSLFGRQSLATLNTGQLPKIFGDDTSSLDDRCRQVVTQCYSTRPSEEARIFFSVGRVFAIEVYEGQGQPEKKIVRRLMVAAASIDGCQCVPITTYKGQGLRKKGLTMQDIEAHTIVYMSGFSPEYLHREPRSSKMALEVDPADDLQKLHPASRASFQQTSHVPHSAKVLDVGHVVKRCLPLLKEYFEMYKTQEV